MMYIELATKSKIYQIINAFEQSSSIASTITSHQPIVNKTRKRRRKRRVKKVKDASEWGVPEWRALLQGKEFTDDDDGVRRVITDVVFSHEDDVYYAKYIIKGEKDIKKNHDYTILRQVFDMAREGGDDWVEDRFYKGKKIE